MEFMENVTPGQRWGVTGGVPPQAMVALKNGWLPLNSARTDWQINSIGWVKGSGRDYLMAVLTTGTRPSSTGSTRSTGCPPWCGGICGDLADARPPARTDRPREPDRQSWLVRYRVSPYFVAIAFHMATKAVLSLVARTSGAPEAWKLASAWSPGLQPLATSSWAHRPRS